MILASELRRKYELFESADAAVKAITPDFGEEFNLKEEEVSDLLTVLCVIGSYRNRYFFAAEKAKEESV